MAKSVQEFLNAANGSTIRATNQYEVYCTEKGNRIHKQGAEVFNEVEQLTFRNFSDEELQQLGSYIDRVMENLETDYSRNKSIIELNEETEK